MYHLGEMYLDGKGVEKDIKKAKKWIQKAAEQGHAEAKDTLNGLNSGKYSSVIEIIKEEPEKIIKFENEKLNNSYSNQSNNNTSAINLTPEEVDQAIVDYFEEIKDYRVSVKEELSLHQDKLDLKFYLIEHLDHDKIEKKLLTEEDLKNALNNYISFYNYELLDFKYIGGIHRTGYYFDKDTPHYDGIKLIVKTKNKEKSLIKKPIN